jgi:hypothetical protein
VWDDVALLDRFKAPLDFLTNVNAASPWTALAYMPKQLWMFNRLHSQIDV